MPLSGSCGVPRAVLALDIGGANLKAAHSSGAARSQPFALWKSPAALPDALRHLLRDWPPYELLAVTMTGELCDCFATKREGVRAILDAVSAVAGAAPVRVWLTDGRLVDIDVARSRPLRAAAANWLALATFAGRFAPRGPALLIDVGSTTTDIIPLLDGRPVPRARADTERLRSGELVYSGVLRTPLCALLRDYGAAEFFATTRDIYLMLGRLPEDPSDCDTADGRPATRACAEARVARMICADLETSTKAERRKVAERACWEQWLQFVGCAGAVGRSLRRETETIILAGVGEFFVEKNITGEQFWPLSRKVSLARELGEEISRAAPAYALAVLASERKR
jgi:probable H4MPT-linked C1 transfer pathway protein